MKVLAYPDLHAHIAALEQAGASDPRANGRSTKIPRCTRWCAGSFAAAFRNRSARHSCSRTSSTAQAAATTCRWRWASSPPIGKSTASASAARSKTSRSNGTMPKQHQIEPVMVENPACQEIVVQGARAQRAGQGRRRTANSDLNAGLRQRALCVLLDVHHQGPRHRTAEHRQLPGDGEKPDPDGDEPRDRAEPGHPRAFSEIQGARRERCRWR